MNSNYPGNNGLLQMIYHREPLELYSPLSPEECVRRLSEAIDEDRRWGTMFGYFGSKPVIGHLTESSIRMRKRIRGRNSFQPFFTATIIPHENGTLIRGKFAVHPYVRIFYAAWMAFVAASFVITAVAASIQMLKSDIVSAAIILPPLGMLFFGYALARFCWHCERNDPVFLANFLCELLDAKEVQATQEQGVPSPKK